MYPPPEWRAKARLTIRARVRARLRLRLRIRIRLRLRLRLRTPPPPHCRPRRTHSSAAVVKELGPSWRASRQPIGLA